MDNNCLDWFRLCHKKGLVTGKLLEIGSAKVQGQEFPNLCETAKQLGVKETLGVDMQAMDGVDEIHDFSIPPSEFMSTWKFGQFDTVCIFNVIEHTFDPITVLTNSAQCLAPSGALLVVAPSTWHIHNHPGDFARYLPNWYEEFARRNKLRIVDECFCWLSEFGIEPVRRYAELPSYISRGDRALAKYWISRVGHKILNTYGRTHWFTQSLIGAVLIPENRERPRSGVT